MTRLSPGLVLCAVRPVSGLWSKRPGRQSAKTPYSRTDQVRRPRFIRLSGWNLTLSRRKIARRHLWRSQYMAMTHFALQELAPHIRGGGGHESG